MKRFFWFTISILGVFTLSALVQKKNNISDELTLNYQSRLVAFYKQLRQADSLNWESMNQTQRVTNYKALRKAYKRAEPSLLYFDPELVTFKLNPAPLPKVEPNAPNLSILEPSGFQLLDEQIAEEHFDSKAFQKSINKIQNDFAPAYRILLQNRILPRNVFEEYRRALITMSTWQITGYDTPGTLGGVEEAMISYKAVWRQLEKVLNVLKYDASLKAKLKRAHRNISSSLASDFENLDRLILLRDGVLPAFKTSVLIQKSSGVEFLDEVQKASTNLNPRSEGFFYDDFFEDTYYVDAPMDSINILLGKLLFFDPILSANNQRSCSNCHQPEKGFTDGLDKSIAYDFKGKVGRNAPTVINSTLSESFFHDLRATSMLLQVEHVVISPDEFNTNFKTIARKLSKSQEYQNLFNNAFRHVRAGDRISKHTVTAALNAYVGSLRSYNSSFDQYVRGEVNDYSEQAKQGFNLFMGKANCGTCHFPPTFSGLVPPLYTESESEVLGVTTVFDTLAPILDTDHGRGQSGRIKDEAPFRKRSFKTPTVRNIALTAPYMHNGSFNTLQEVMHFYNRGGGAGLGLDVPYQTLAEDRLRLTHNEMDAIIAFMQTLTDTTGMSNRPKRLPVIDNPELNKRKIGGIY